MLRLVDSLKCRILEREINRKWFGLLQPSSRATNRLSFVEIIVVRVKGVDRCKLRLECRCVVDVAVAVRGAVPQAFVSW